MTGYQEILTDPSYAGQIVAMTYPQIGNVGVNRRGRRVARGRSCRGFVVKELLRRAEQLARAASRSHDFLRAARRAGDRRHRHARARAPHPRRRLPDRRALDGSRRSRTRRRSSRARAARRPRRARPRRRGHAATRPTLERGALERRRGPGAARARGPSPTLQASSPTTSASSATSCACSSSRAST